jgi:hypothetical protein
VSLGAGPRAPPAVPRAPPLDPSHPLPCRPLLHSPPPPRRPSPSPLKPVEEMLVTAIHTSRATLRRLVERQAALEAEIASEQKQAARLEWLLNRVGARAVACAAGGPCSGRGRPHPLGCGLVPGRVHGAGASAHKFPPSHLVSHPTGPRRLLLLFSAGFPQQGERVTARTRALHPCRAVKTQPPRPPP